MDLDAVLRGPKVGKTGLGKLFLSHSSMDKPIVRKLARRLQDEGYDVWLDEKQIVAGDALAGSISEAIRASKVVIIVVSAASLQSRWLKYEMDAAAQRMIDGKCRLIPILIEDVEVPAELEGRLYVDLRRGRRGGLRKLLTALEHEAEQRPARVASTSSPDYMSRHKAYDALVSNAFGGMAYASMSPSPTRDLSWRSITVAGGVEAVYDSVMTYSSTSGSYSLEDFDDWRRFIEEEAGEGSGMLVVEMKVGEDLLDALQVSDGVAHVRRAAGLFEPSGLYVLVDASDRPDDARFQERLLIARRLFEAEHADRESPLLDKNNFRPQRG